jgi:septal ring factor EnvC (AmiA/AmiB activator)
MQAIQADLDATTGRLERLRTEQEDTRRRIASSEKRVTTLRKRTLNLRAQVVERADALYRSGGTLIVEALLDSDSLSELTDRAELLARASLEDTGVFVRMARARADLADTLEELEQDRARLARTTKELAEEADELQRKLKAARADYAQLRSKLAAPVVSSSAPAPAPVRFSGAMACPVAGPHSFTDTWGAPRGGGRSHRGVDMMAAYGTPESRALTARDCRRSPITSRGRTSWNSSRSSRT